MRTLSRVLPKVIREQAIDFVVANGENAAQGVGITPNLADSILDAGVHCVTTGNHVWRHREIRDYIDREPRLLRPLNFPEIQPGSGIGQYETAAGISVGVINLAGRVFMDPANNPFTTADTALTDLAHCTIKLVDFHAEATSEKRAMGFYLDGRVTCIVGTHTHVQTADEQILPQGTAYITDMGMTGPHDSIIGMRKDLVLNRFVTGLPNPFRLSNDGVRFQAVQVEANTETGSANTIKRLDIPAD